MPIFLRLLIRLHSTSFQKSSYTLVTILISSSIQHLLRNVKQSLEWGYVNETIRYSFVKYTINTPKYGATLKIQISHPAKHTQWKQNTTHSSAVLSNRRLHIQECVNGCSTAQMSISYTSTSLFKITLNTAECGLASSYKPRNDHRGNHWWENENINKTRANYNEKGWYIFSKSPRLLLC
jgi:hypothetical protein